MAVTLSKLTPVPNSHSAVAWIDVTGSENVTCGALLYPWPPSKLTIEDTLKSVTKENAEAFAVTGGSATVIVGIFSYPNPGFVISIDFIVLPTPITGVSTAWVPGI